MNRLVQRTVWILAYLMLISSSNYFINQNTYVQNYSLPDMLISNFSILFIGYNLFCLSRKARLKTLYWLGLIILFLCVFVAFSELIVYKYSGVGFTTQSFLHFEYESLKVGFNIYPFEITIFVAVLIVTVWYLSRPITKFTNKTYWSLLSLSIVLLLYTFFGSALGRLSTNYIAFKNKQSVPALSIDKVIGYEKFGIRPVHYTNHEIEASFVKTKKNVIVIYMESFSHFFTTALDYPELTPNLEKLTNKYGQLKNYHSTAGFTMQGLMSSMCGFLPQMLFENDDLNIAEQPYQALPCLPDVLHNLGYNQEFIGGALKTFSNKERFLINHKFNKVWGWHDYGKDDKYTKNDWGLQDDDLYDFALERILELNQTDTPFQVSILNLSTHLSGNPAPSCPKYTNGKKQHKYLDGIHCLDFLIGKFILQLKKHNILKNTVVYLTSDHGVFDVDLIKDLFHGSYDRHKLFGLIIDEESTIDQEKLIGLYDLAPNIIELLGIKTNVTFINGIPFSKINESRLLLRRGVLRQGANEVSIQQHCKREEMITFPLDRCERQDLLNLSYGHAESFTTNKELINIISSNSKIFIHSSTKKYNLSKLDINSMKQDDKFYNEGFRINNDNRHKKNHLFVLVYDLTNKAVLQRRAFVYQNDKAFRLSRMLKKLNDNYAIILFTDGFQQHSIPKTYVDTLTLLGAKKLTTKHEPYIAILKKVDGIKKYFEWLPNEEKIDSVSIFLDGINDPKLN